MRKWLAMSVLAAVFVLGVVSESLAVRPSGWAFMNYPYMYDPASGDWYWFNAGDTQWVNGFTTGGWVKLNASAVTSGWVNFRWPYVYCAANGSWYYINEVDTQWVVNLGSSQWRKFGEHSVPSRMVLILAGSYNGTNPDTGIYYSFSLSQSTYIDKFEVTKAQWDQVYNWAIQNGYSFSQSGSGKAPNHPVHSVTWHDAIKWCNARSEKEGREPVYRIGSLSGPVFRTAAHNDVYTVPVSGYRVPTLRLWRIAALGGSGSHRFPWADSDLIQHSRANYNSSSSYAYDTSSTRGYHPLYNAGGTPYTAPVGSFASNGYGLYDMAGNVAEWLMNNDVEDEQYRHVAGGDGMIMHRSVGFLTMIHGIRRDLSTALDSGWH